MKDYYKVLGVERNATAEDIKKAYKKLAYQYHPDRPSGNEAKFKEVNEAYQILSNQDKKKQYDQFGRTFDGANPFGGGPFGGSWEFGFDASGFEDLGNISEIFDAFFEGLGVKKRKTYHRGADLEMALEITLEEAFAGATKPISFNSFISCKKCGGIGYFEKDGFASCSACDGRGEIKEMRSGFFGQFSQVRQCGKCFGLGKIPKNLCAECFGAGRKKDKKNIEVNIASGIRSGQIIKITGAGEAGERGAATGDLYLRISVKPHPVFERKEDDLFTKKEVSLLDILLDKKIKTGTISGKDFEFLITPGSDINQEIKVQGEGMPRLSSSRRGDLYIRLEVKTPKKLSAKAKKLLEDLKIELD